MSPTGFSHNWIHSSRGLQGSFSKDHQKPTALNDDRQQIENSKEHEDQNLDNRQNNELNDPSNFLGQKPQRSRPDHAETCQNQFYTPQKPFVEEHPDTFSLPKDRQRRNTMDAMFPREKEGDGVCRVNQEQPSATNHANEPNSNPAPPFRSNSMDSYAASLASTRSIVDEPLVCNHIPHEDHSYENMPGRYASETVPSQNHVNPPERRSPRTSDTSRRRSLTQSIGKLFRKQNE